MILHDVNSEDYLYLRLLGESKDYPFYYSHLKEGTILRFQLENLSKWLWRSNVFKNLDCFHFEERKKKSKKSYSPLDIYSKITVVKDIDLLINMDAKDVLLMDEWLWDRLHSSERPIMTSANQLSFLFGTEKSKSPIERNWYHLEHTKLFRPDGKEVQGSSIFEMDTPRMALPENTLLSLPSSFIDKKNNGGKIVDCYQFGNETVIVVPLRRGDIIDFSSPVTTLLFLRQDVLRLLLNTEAVSEQEHLKYFERDFEGYLPTIGRRYFKLHDYLKLRRLNDLFDSKVWAEIRKRSSTFQNPFSYYGNDYRVSKVCFDGEGYIRYIWCSDEPIVEHELSKIADRVSFEEAQALYEKEQKNKKREEEEKELQRRATEYVEKNKGRYNKLQKRNPNLTYVDFMRIDSAEQGRVKKETVKRLLLVLNYRRDILKKKE